jgi:hypothetical protein
LLEFAVNFWSHAGMFLVSCWNVSGLMLGCFWSHAAGMFLFQTVPSWFIKEHGDKLRQSVVLRSAATKKKWTVHLGVYYPRNVAQVRFYAGWRDFACSNGLGEGDLLVFCLREVSHFDVYMHRKADAPSLEAPSPRRRNSKLLMRPGTQSTVSEMLVAKAPATHYDAIPNLISSSEAYPCFIKRIVISNLRDAQGYASGASLVRPQSHMFQPNSCKK